MQAGIILLLPGVVVLRWLWKIFFAPHPLDNIRGPDSPSFITGHLRVLFSTWPGRQFQRDIVDTYGRVVLLKGAFGKRQLYVADPRALQVVAVRQDLFDQQPSFVSWNKAIIGEGILSTLGAQHRKQRKILNPVFNIKHLRELTPVFTEIATKLCHRISEEAQSGKSEVDLIVWFSHTALELIGVGGIGRSFGALDGGEHEYVKGLRLLGISGFALMIPRLFLPYVQDLGTQKLRRRLWELVPWIHIHNVLDAVDVMWKTTLDIYHRYGDSNPEALEVESKYKEVVAANNIMMVLKKANQATNPAERMSDDEMKGQINALVAAANVTTSRSLTRVVHMLTQREDWQDRVRAEILAAKAVAGELNFDQLDALPLLDALIRETMRCYPPIANMARICQQDTTIPLMHPVTGRDGRTITEIAVPAGTDVYVAVLPPNTDYAIWGPDAREWKPERWLAPLPPSVGEAHIPGVYAHQMTFLAGNRACIGFKFALLEMKVVLSALLTHFKFSAGKDEIEWIHAGIYQPIVGKNLKPTLPVRVDVLRDVA